MARRGSASSSEASDTSRSTARCGCSGSGRLRSSSLPSTTRAGCSADALREALRGSAGPAIVCAQAGNVNTGASDPFTAIAEACEGAGAWLHVDGAFGLWAAASPRFEHLVEGVERADSWATDAHKWLNVPYDCGRRLLPASGSPRGRDGGGGELSPARRRTEPVRLGAGVVPPRTRIRGLGGVARPGPQRRRGAGRPLLRPCAHLRRPSSARRTASRS